MKEWQTFSEIVRSILIMSVTGSVASLFLFALKSVLKNRLPKNVQYYLWCLALIAFLVPFSAFISLPFSTPMSQIQEVVRENIKTTAERREQLSQEQYGVEYDALESQQQIDISFVQIGLAKGDFNDYLLLVIASYGVVSFLIEMLVYIVYTLKLKARRIDSKEEEMALLKSLCSTNKCPRLYRNSLIMTPMLIGIFRRIIYLPDREYSKAQLQNIMLHELMHLKRHDVAIKWIGSIAVYLHWFNPLVYLVRSEIDRACELSCDEAVISNLSIDEKQSYGDTLIEMASDTKNPKVIVSTTMCEEKKTLKDRLSAIMQSKKPTKAVIHLSCILLGIVFCAVIIFGSSSNYSDCTTLEERELRLREISNLGVTTTISQEIIIGGYIISGYETTDRYGLAIFEPIGSKIYKFQTNDNRFKIDGDIVFATAIINHKLYSLFWANKLDLDYIEVKLSTDDIAWTKPIILDAKDNKIMYMKAPSDNYSFSVSIYDIHGDLYKTASDITPTFLKNSEDELLSVMRENIVQEGLTLEITK